MNILEWSSVCGEHKVFAGTTLVDESGGFLVNPVLFCLEEPLRSDAAIVMIDKLRWVLINSDVKHALLGKGLSGFEVKDVYVKRGT